MAEDLSDETWDALDESARRTEDDRGLGMLLKMTRCHDLGLGQLFFPGEDMDQKDEVVSPSLVEDSVEPRRSSEHPAAGHQNQCTHEPTPH